MRFQKRPLLTLCLLLNTTFIFAQTKTITGKVTDNSNSPIVNASVTVQGTKKGTTTVSDGTFKLEIPLSAKKLIISSVGYIMQEADITSSSEISVSLKPQSGS